MSNSEREFEVVVWGATGFTGRLVAAHLFQHYREKQPLRWAIGGRNLDKLNRVAGEIGIRSGQVPILLGDSHDRTSLDEIARRGSVICSAVGPYAKHGSELVAACVEHGTHYCDLSGEVPWMREMIDRYQARAQETGARIVHSCGFDSVPSDLGCLFLQHHVQADYQAVCGHVKLRVRKMRGSLSGGTIASLLNLIDGARRNARIRETIADPYALNPLNSRSGPDGPDQQVVQWDRDLRGWTAPFLMAPINTRVVRRSNAVLGYPYGREFRYEEAILTGKGLRGWLSAQAVALGASLLFAAAKVQPTRAALERWILPRPGQGPSARERREGSFKVQIIGKLNAAATRSWSTVVTGERDPGYGSTSSMLAESAVCLAQDADRFSVGGGFWTPASCFGLVLVQRLEDRAGMRFVMEGTAQQERTDE